MGSFIGQFWTLDSSLNGTCCMRVSQFLTLDLLAQLVNMACWGTRIVSRRARVPAYLLPVARSTGTGAALRLDAPSRSFDLSPVCLEYRVQYSTVP